MHFVSRSNLLDLIDFMDPKGNGSIHAKKEPKIQNKSISFLNCKHGQFLL